MAERHFHTFRDFRKNVSGQMIHHLSLLHNAPVKAVNKPAYHDFLPSKTAPVQAVQFSKN